MKNIAYYIENVKLQKIEHLIENKFQKEIVY